MDNGSVKSFQLTAQQAAFFRMFGYLVFPGLLLDCIDEITQAFNDVFERCGQVHDGQERTSIVPFIDRHERLSALLDDPRIDGICTGLMGDDYNFLGSDGNYYVGDTQWHCDWWHENIAYIKIAFYLDPVRQETGALRVIPGSHVINDYRSALGDSVVDSRNTLGISGRDVPTTALESNPGDVVCFHLNALHAAYGGSNRRRMFTINACQHHPDDHIAHLQKFMAVNLDRPSYYGQIMLDTAGPGRHRHLQQVQANETAARSLADAT